MLATKLILAWQWVTFGLKLRSSECEIPRLFNTQDQNIAKLAKASSKHEIFREFPKLWLNMLQFQRSENFGHVSKTSAWKFESTGIEFINAPRDIGKRPKCWVTSEQFGNLGYFPTRKILDSIKNQSRRLQLGNPIHFPGTGGYMPLIVKGFNWFYFCLITTFENFRQGLRTWETSGTF